MKNSFLTWHINNGGDVSTADGNSIEPETPKRQPNPSLKRHNYKFANSIEVIDSVIVANKKNN